MAGVPVGVIVPQCVRRSSDPVRTGFPDPLIELVAHRLRVLGQPLRIRIVIYLERHGETSVQTLADQLHATQQNISRHLGLLLQAGVVARRREGRIVWYRLVDQSAFKLVDRTRLDVLDSLKRRQLGPHAGAARLVRTRASLRRFRAAAATP